jgi:hypothetical protein
MFYENRVSSRLVRMMNLRAVKSPLRLHSLLPLCHTATWEPTSCPPEPSRRGLSLKDNRSKRFVPSTPDRTAFCRSGNARPHASKPCTRAFASSVSWKSWPTVESAGGAGLSSALGIAGFTNVDVVRNPTLGRRPLHRPRNAAHDPGEPGNHRGHAKPSVPRVDGSHEASRAPPG